MISGLSSGPPKTQLFYLWRHQDTQKQSSAIKSTVIFINLEILEIQDVVDLGKDGLSLIHI